MRLISIGIGSAITPEDVAELADENVAIMTGSPEELRALAPLLLKEGSVVVDRDVKPENVWLVKDEQSLYLNATEGQPDVFARAQHCATRFTDREVAREHARKYRRDGAHLVRLSSTSSTARGGSDGSA